MPVITIITNRTIDMPQSQSLNPITTDKPSPVVSVNPHLSPRSETVAALWELVQRTRVVHVRGTPASGKTILARLLQQYVQNTSPNVQVYLFIWDPDHFSSKGLDIGSDCNELLNCATKQLKPLGNWRHIQDTLLLIDEAQLSYKYNGLMERPFQVHMWNKIWSSSLFILRFAVRKPYSSRL
jgi:hypothetical protein